MPVLTTALTWLFSKYSNRLLSNVTGISISTLMRYRLTGNIPTVKYYNQLTNRYRSVMYTYLRASGASVSVANRFKSGAPDKIFQVIHKYQEAAIKIATEYDVDVNDVTVNMARSQKEYEEVTYQE